MDRNRPGRGGRAGRGDGPAGRSSSLGRIPKMQAPAALQSFPFQEHGERPERIQGDAQQTRLSRLNEQAGNQDLFLVQRAVLSP